LSAFTRDVFEGTDDGGADSDNAASLVPGGLELRGSFRGDGHVFGVEGMVARVFGLDRLECAGANLEGDIDEGVSLLLERSNETGGEVEAGGGGGGAAGFPTVDGLVSLGAASIGDDVWGQRDFANGCGIEGSIEFDVDGFVLATQRRCKEGTVVSFEAEAAAGDSLASGAHEHFPGGVGEGANQEDLDAAAGVFAGAKEAGSHDAGIVPDEDIAGVEEGGEIAEMGVFDRLPGAMEHHEPGRVTGFGGLLCYLCLGEFEIEVGGAHRVVRALRLYGSQSRVKRRSYSG
jgi:hypothetical protein